MGTYLNPGNSGFRRIVASLRNMKLHRIKVMKNTCINMMLFIGIWIQ
jgi:hypothetical protein